MSDEISRALREARIREATPKTDEEKRIRREALETFSFAKAQRLVEPLGEIYFQAWRSIQGLEEVRIAAIYSSDPPAFDWRDPIQRGLERDFEEERPVARLEVSMQMVGLRQRLRALRDLVSKTLDDEAIP